MELHSNLIDGEWVGGEAAPNLNPANTAEVVGEYARGTAEDAAPPSPPPRPPSRPGAARARCSATRC